MHDEHRSLPRSGPAPGGKSDLPRVSGASPHPDGLDGPREEGYYSVFAVSGARIEMPGCSLCMATRRRRARRDGDVDLDPELPQPLGLDTQVYPLGRARRGVRSDGKIPTVSEYMQQMAVVEKKAGEIYRYMNFDQIPHFSNA